MNKHFEVYKTLVSTDPDNIALITGQCPLDIVGAKMYGVLPLLTASEMVAKVKGQLNEFVGEYVIQLMDKENSGPNALCAVYKLTKVSDYKVSKLKPSQWPVIEATESKYVSRINTRKNTWSILLDLEYVGELYQNELFELHPTLAPRSNKNPNGRVYSGGISTVSKARRAAKKK
jgi:hypothetical protein